MHLSFFRRWHWVRWQSISVCRRRCRLPGFWFCRSGSVDLLPQTVLMFSLTYNALTYNVTVKQQTSLFSRSLIAPALKQSFIKLSPRIMFRNPVMFTVEIGTLIMLLVIHICCICTDAATGNFGYNLAVLRYCCSPCCLPILPSHCWKREAKAGRQFA